MSTVNLTYVHPSGRWGDPLRLKAGHQPHIPRPPPSSWVVLSAKSATLLEARVPYVMGYKASEDTIEWKIAVDLISQSVAPTDPTFNWLPPTEGRVRLMWNQHYLCKLELTIPQSIQEALPSLALKASLRESRFPSRVSLLPPFVIELTLQSPTPQSLVESLTQWTQHHKSPLPLL